MGLLGNERKNYYQKNTLNLKVSQGKISSPNRSIFPAEIADFGLNYCILNVKAKNRTSGRKIAWGPPKIFPTGRCTGQDFPDSCPKDQRVPLIIDGIKPLTR
jgi:hypothetical protein